MKKGQIAHLNHNAGNGAEDNLAWLCLDHHTEYDSTTRQHRNFTIGEIKKARSDLHAIVESKKARSDENAVVESRKRCEWVLVLSGGFSDVDKEKIEVIVDHMRNHLRDPNLTMKRLETGSVRLVIESSEAAFAKARRLFERQELKEVGGLPVQDIHKVVMPPQSGHASNGRANGRKVVRRRP